MLWYTCEFPIFGRKFCSPSNLNLTCLNKLKINVLEVFELFWIKIVYVD